MSTIRISKEHNGSTRAPVTVTVDGQPLPLTTAIAFGVDSSFRPYLSIDERDEDAERTTHYALTSFTFEAQTASDRQPFTPAIRE